MTSGGIIPVWCYPRIVRMGFWQIMSLPYEVGEYFIRRAGLPMALTRLEVTLIRPAIYVSLAAVTIAVFDGFI